MRVKLTSGGHRGRRCVQPEAAPAPERERVDIANL